jgi:hypothetical protein
MPGAPSRRCGYYLPTGAASQVVTSTFIPKRIVRVDQDPGYSLLESRIKRPQIVPPVFFTSTFSATENPISESGSWRHNGLDWTVIETSGGFALCTQDGLGTPSSNLYNDSYAYLSGFPPNQLAELTIHVEGSITGNQEAECLLRWSDSAHSATGYEVMIPRAGSSYKAQVVKWNGPYGDFTYVSNTWANPDPIDGDKWQAQIIGTIITARLIRAGSVIWSDIADVTNDKNGTPISVITSGDPGIGLFRHNNGGSTTPINYCATAFMATSL